MSEDKKEHDSGEVASPSALLGWHPIETIPEYESVVLLTYEKGKPIAIVAEKSPDLWYIIHGRNGCSGMCREIHGVRGWMPIIPNKEVHISPTGAI